MKTITVPADITFVDIRTGQPMPTADGHATLSFSDFAFMRWLNEQEGSSSVVVQTRWAKVIDKFLEAPKAGDVIDLDEEDWRLLCTIVDRVSCTIPPLALRQLRPFFDAVKDAPDFKREEPKAKSNAEIPS